MNRDQNIQKISWFWDLRQRRLLDLDPPYQRRSVWTQEYRDYFIDTILLNYPAPAIFLFEETSPEGVAKYHVVDGKQRLTAIFDFLEDDFPVGEKAKRPALRGLNFSQFSDDEKRQFFSYKFTVEYIPNADEGVINAIFDRINRNVAKLSPQELRHAKYDGKFITSAEALSESMTRALPTDFPRIASSSKKHMKDVEFVAELLLYLEVGPRNHSQLDLDNAFAERDSVWDAQAKTERSFNAAIAAIADLVKTPAGKELLKSRMRNQADFYALFAAVHALKSSLRGSAAQVSARRLQLFLSVVDDDAARVGKNSVDAREYYDAARSNSNDIGQRKKRIEIVTRVLGGTAAPLSPSRRAKSSMSPAARGSAPARRKNAVKARSGAVAKQAKRGTR